MQTPLENWAAEEGTGAAVDSRLRLAQRRDAQGVNGLAVA